MKNTILANYLRDVKKNLKHLPIRERDSVMQEIQLHLEEQIKSRPKTVSLDEATLKATHAFGEPHEIGVSYGAQGGVVNRSTGERLLDVAVLTSRAAGRGAKGVLKWSGVSALVLIGVALVLVITAAFVTDSVLDEFGDDIRANIPRPLYSYSDDWELTEAHFNVRTDSFELGEEMREVKISLNTGVEAGCVNIQVTLPDGTTTDLNGNGCEDVERYTTYTQSGTYRVQYTFIAFAGSVDVHAVGFGDGTGTY